MGRLESTAGYADALADWVEGSRLAVARALAEVLGSTEAVPGPARRPPPVPGTARRVRTAAAEIATRVLSVLGVAYDGAETLLRQWTPSLAESTWRSTSGPSYHADPCGSADRDRVCSPGADARPPCPAGPRRSVVG